MYQLTEKGLQTIQTYDSAEEGDLRLFGMSLIVPVLESIHASPKPSFKQIMQDTGLSHFELMGAIGSMINHGYLTLVGHRVKRRIPTPTKEQRRRAGVVRYRRYPELGRTLSSERSKEKYWSDPEIREKVLERCRNRLERKRLDPEWVEKERARGREKYHRLRSDTEWAEKERIRGREKYQKKMLDPEWAEKERARSRERYHRLRSEPEWVEKERIKDRERYQKRRLDPEWVEKINAKRRDRYRQGKLEKEGKV